MKNAEEQFNTLLKILAKEEKVLFEYPYLNHYNLLSPSKIF